MAKTKADKIVNDSKVAHILTAAINASPKTQLQIAEEVGFDSANMVTMVKQGRTKLPISKVLLVANCLDIDAKDLLSCCLQEYQPSEWAVIREIFDI